MIKNTLYFTALILAILFTMAVFSESNAQISIDTESSLLFAPDAEITDENPLGLREDSCYHYQAFQMIRKRGGFVPIFLTSAGDAVFGKLYDEYEGESGKWNRYNPSYQVFSPNMNIANSAICVSSIYGLSSIYQGDTNAER